MTVVALPSSVAGHPVFTAPDHIHSKPTDAPVGRFPRRQCHSGALHLAPSRLSAPIHSDDVLNSLRQAEPRPLQASSLSRRGERFEVCKEPYPVPPAPYPSLCDLLTYVQYYGTEVYYTVLRLSPCHPFIICAVPGHFDVPHYGRARLA
jgi:hypothetical protein